MPKRDIWPAVGGIAAIAGVLATVVMPIIMADFPNPATPGDGKGVEASPWWITFGYQYVKYVGPTIVVIGVLILLYQFHRRQRQKMAALGETIAEQQQKIAELMAREPCTFGGNCLVDTMVDLWPKNECSGLQGEVKEFLSLKLRKKAYEKSATEYMVRASNLREDEGESWHVLYATPNAVSENYGGVHKNWIANEDPATKGRRKRIMIVSTDPQATGQYGETVKLMIAKLSETSQLRIIFEQALVQRSYSGLLRDFGVFRNRTTLKYEVLMSFGLCDYADVFSSMPGKSFSTNDQDYADRLVKAFESAWTSEDLREEFAVAKKIYGQGCVLA